MAHPRCFRDAWGAWVSGLEEGSVAHLVPAGAGPDRPVHRQEQAGELAQEVLGRLLHNLPRFSGAEKIKPTLFVIIKPEQASGDIKKNRQMKFLQIYFTKKT